MVEESGKNLRMISIYFTAIFWNFRKTFTPHRNLSFVGAGFTQARWGQILVGLAYLIILGFLFIALFFLSRSSFLFLYNFREVSRPIIDYILLSALAFTGILSVFSFIISFSFRLFEKKLAIYILAGSSPVSVFQAIFWENFLLGGWPFLILALPLLLAFLAVNNASFGSYLTLVILFIILILLTESLGAILVFSLRFLLGKTSKKAIYLLAFFAFVGLGMIFKNIFLPAGLWEVSSRPALKEVFTGLSSLPLANPWLPSSLFIRSLTGNLPAFLIFTFQAFLIYSLSLALAGRFYLKTWQKSQEGVFVALPRQKTDSVKTAVKFRGVFWSLFNKEFLAIERTPALLLYLAFVFFLALVYFFLLSQSPKMPEFSPNLFPKVMALTVMIIGYLITMLALRFTFPCLVLEFKSFWIISPIPKARRKILLAKWTASSLLAILTGWILAVLAFFFLRLSFDFLPFILGIVLAGAFLISAANLFIGTWWAHELPREDVEQTTTALPGVLATLASIFIALTLSLAFYQIIMMAPDGEVKLLEGNQKTFLMALILSISLLFWFLAFTMGERKFKRMDIR